MNDFAEEIGLDKDASFTGGASRQEIINQMESLFKKFGVNKSEIDSSKAFINALARESFPDMISTKKLRARKGGQPGGHYAQNYNRRTDTITPEVVLTDSSGLGLTNSMVFIHEMAHHLFEHALSHNERMEFFRLVRAKSFDANGKKIDNPYRTDRTNYDEKAEEVFTHEFQRYVYRRFTPDEQQSWDFWKKLVNKYVKPIFDWHASANRDTDFDEIFKKLLPEATDSTPTGRR